MTNSTNLDETRIKTLFKEASVIGLITFILSFFAVYIGHTFGDLFKNKIELVCGLFLIFFGSKILVEHLLQ